MKLTLGQVAGWIHADGEFDTLAEAVGVGSGSRTSGAGVLFFAVAGARVHGDNVAVIEMGMNHPGEIAALAKIAEPDWGVVSNVGPVHLEFFPDGLAGIARAKYELIEALPNDGVAILNFDDPYVCLFGKGMGSRAVLFGTGEGADVRAVHVAEVAAEGGVFTVETKGERASV